MAIAIRIKAIISEIFNSQQEGGGGGDQNVTADSIEITADNTEITADDDATL